MCIFLFGLHFLQCKVWGITEILIFQITWLNEVE